MVCWTGVVKLVIATWAGSAAACEAGGAPEIVRDPPAAAPAVGARQVEPLYRETFAEGEAALEWRLFPGFSPDPPRPQQWEDAPAGDGWAGVVTNETFGGFASLSYTGVASLADYSIAAWVYVEVTDRESGPLQGIAFRVDPEEERFYRLAAHFGADPELSFAYVGRDVDNFPVYLRRWGADEIPGGAPTTDGWHQMEIRGSGDRFRVFWNRNELPGGPFTDDRIDQGYFGIYTNFVGGQELARTAIDDLVVTSLE